MVWWACPACRRPISLLGDRASPPIFTWEVYPHLYPGLPPAPGPTRGRERIVFTVLLALAVALSALTAVATAEGAVALGPGPFTVQGVVTEARTGGGTGSALPISGASVTVAPETGPTLSARTSASGAFAIGGLPPGRSIVNVSDAGFAPQTFVVFFSSAYSTSGGPGAPLSIALAPESGASSGPVTYVLTPFADLESFVAAEWSAAILLGIGALVALGGALAAYRRERPGLALAGSAAAAVAPASVFLLPVSVAYPAVGVAAVATISGGTILAGIAAIRLARIGRPLDPES